MLRSYWLATATLGIAFLSSPVLSQEGIDPILENQPVAKVVQNPSATAGYNAAECEHKKIISLNTPSGRFESFSCDEVAKKDKAEDSEQLKREIRDLEAQESMALWAKFMFWATLGGIAISAGGILLVWRTLISTNESVLETRRSNDINTASQRPWLSFEAEFIGSPSLNIGANMVFLPLNLRIRNDGVSPALDTHVWVDSFQTKSFDFIEEYNRIIDAYEPTLPLVDEPLFKEREKKWATGVKLDIREPDGDIVIAITMFYRGVDSAKLHHTCVFYYASILDEVKGSLDKIIYHFKMT